MSAGQIRDLAPAWTPAYTYGSMRLYNNYSRTYAALYREQPNVRVCVDFLSRNIAQLGLHVFRRVSDTDRQRLTDHDLARLIRRPLPAEFKLSRFRLVETIMGDLGIYFNAYLLKVRAGPGAVMGLLPVPPDLVTPVGGLVIKGYEVDLGTKRLKLAPDDLVHFRGYNPESRIAGLSPLETLRRVLAEEHAAGNYRENFWKNAARMHGIIRRPASAPDWSEQARERFRAEFDALYAGEEASGTTAVLEEDMTWERVEFNPQEAEYLGGRKLTREECARAFHIPLPLVGILDHATFSNIKEQHKHLYADCLGPWLTMIEEDLALQLLPDFADSDDVYLQFNIQEKLEGSFEEQATSFSTAVGRPYMTADEARARMNLPSLGGDAARLVTPLNVLVGGQASPRDSAPDETGQASLPLPRVKGLDSHAEGLREQHERRWTEGLASHYRRQEAAIVSRVPKGRKLDIGGVWFDEERWNRELAADLLRLNNLTATAWAEALIEAGGLDVEDMEAFE
ncbi:MAG TPA: phage portal protein, partial [Candidatus Brocadiia bacterium]|nr:phage portal protein [Candidatus Brocadiia bacterium]